MPFTVSCQCPQCGAALPLGEGQRFLACEFCGANNFLGNRKMPWLTMPVNSDGDRTVFIPYLRCRGPLFTCIDGKIDFKVIDATSLIAQIPGVPSSLGIRPQAVKLSFPDPKKIAIRLPVKGKTSKHLGVMVRQGYRRPNHPPQYQALLGEVMARVYLPLVIREDCVCDGTSGQKLAIPPETLRDTPARQSSWQPIFHAAICPGCGWDLDGDETSQVLLCRNCATAWTGDDDGLARVNLELMPGGKTDDHYLPFWRVRFTLPAQGVESAADLEDLLTLPTRGLTRNQRMPAILTPAFKIKPKDFLRLSVQLSHARPESVNCETVPKRVQPMSVSRSEAAQAIRTVLAARATLKKKFFPRLSELKPMIKAIDLLLLPFSDRGYNLFQESHQINVNRQALNLGRLI